MADQYIQRSADLAMRLRDQAARLAFQIEHEIGGRNGPLIYILSCAHMESVAALAELADVKATDVDKILELQNKVQRYSDIRIWLKNAVMAGRAATHEMQPEVFDEWARDLSPSDDEA